MNKIHFKINFEFYQTIMSFDIKSFCNVLRFSVILNLNLKDSIDVNSS